SYLLASRFSLKLQLALLGVIVLLSPWLIVRGLMFRARYSSWRGLTFRFMPEYGAAYGCYLFAYLLFPFTIGFIFPYVKWLQKRFVVENHRFGGMVFSFAAKASEFYVVYFIAIGMVITVWIALSIVFGAALSGHGAGRMTQTLAFTLTGAVYAIY